MKRPTLTPAPVTFFLGARSISVPVWACYAALLLPGLSCGFALANLGLPRLLGTAPLLALPDPLAGIVLGVAWLTGIAVLIWAMLGLFGLWEARLADRRLTDFDQLVPMSEAPARNIVIAPNLSHTARADLIDRLHSLAGAAGTSSILAPLRPGDRADGSVDRLFVTTTLSAKQFRRLIRPLHCDDAAQVPPRLVSQVRRKAAFGTGAIWLLTWD